MREDDRFGHVVPLLRRTIVLVAVIIAVPVILWTITNFVRTYVGPPRVPTFRQLAASATINAASGPQTVAQLPQDTAGSGPVVEARATVSDARDSVGLKGDQTAEANPQGAALASDASGGVPPSPLGTAAGGATGALATAQPTPGGDEGSDSLSPAAPLPGPIPLPRRRPRDIETRTADNASANVPIPRRRPEGAGSGAPADTSSGSSPIGFIQNMFH
jgi:hypothetical protein